MKMTVTKAYLIARREPTEDHGFFINITSPAGGESPRLVLRCGVNLNSYEFSRFFDFLSCYDLKTVALMPRAQCHSLYRDCP